MKNDATGKAPLRMPASARFIMAVFGLVFGGIGLCVLGLVWSDAGSFAPTFMRIFASLIAVAFVAFGGVMAVTAIRGAVALPNLPLPTTASIPEPQPSPGVYTCPHCGGGLNDSADVSPMGDAKCAFCGRWFNIHGKT